MTILLLTPLRLEFEAVSNHLNSSSIQSVQVKGNFYEQGQFQGRYQSHNIILRQTGSKNTDIALATERAIQHFNPNVIILTGIAGGIKDVKISDVVVANKLYGYEGGKETENGFVSRPEVFYCSPDLYELAQKVGTQNDWKNRSSESKNSEVLFGPIASGEKVIATTNSEVFARLKKHYNDVLAIEMEASGFGKVLLNYPLIKFINIRGVSDLLHNKTFTDEEGGQEIAMQNASAFVIELLYQLDSNTLNEPKEMTDLKLFVKDLYQQVLPLLQKEAGEDVLLPANAYSKTILEKVKPLLVEEYAEVVSDFKDEDAHAGFRNQLRKALKRNEELQRELVALMEKGKATEKGNNTNINNSKNVIANSSINVGGNFRLGDG